MGDENRRWELRLNGGSRSGQLRKSRHSASHFASHVTSDCASDFTSHCASDCASHSDSDSDSAPVPCTFSVKVAVKTDNYPSETSWDLVNQCDGTGTIGTSKSYSSTGTFEDEYCLPAAKYKFTINDSYGDGICCNYGIGSYEVSLNGGVTKTGDGNFGSTEDHDLGSCGNPG